MDSDKILQRMRDVREVALTSPSKRDARRARRELANLLKYYPAIAKANEIERVVTDQASGVILQNITAVEFESLHKIDPHSFKK